MYDSHPPNTSPNVAPCTLRSETWGPSHLQKAFPALRHPAFSHAEPVHCSPSRLHLQEPSAPHMALLLSALLPITLSETGNLPHFARLRCSWCHPEGWVLPGSRCNPAWLSFVACPASRSHCHSGALYCVT